MPKPPDFCRHCGLAFGETDITGCTNDTVTAHEYVQRDSRPFADWTWDQLLARFGRARMKGISSRATAEHFAACPTGGPNAFETLIYEQKARKRLGLAYELMAEIRQRPEWGTTLRGPNPEG